MRPIAVCIMLRFAALCVQADILHMRDGSRYYGELIRRTESEILFRVVRDDSGASVVRSIRAASVKRVEIGGRDAPPAGSGDRPASQPAIPDEDFEQMLREAFELVDDHDLAAALKALQRIVTRAPAERLAALDRRARETRGRSLPAFMAETRLRRALHGPAGRVFELRYATRYEAVALADRLTALHEQLLSRAYQETTIREWAAAPTAYDVLAPDAPQMVYDTRVAAAAIGARLKFDPALERDRVTRARLVAIREALARFAAHVESMPGYTTLRRSDDDNDPTLIEARRLEAQPAATTQPLRLDSQRKDPESGDE